MILFAVKDGQALAAMAAYLPVSRATASADMGVPLRVLNGGASTGAWRSAIHSTRLSDLGERRDQP